LVQATNTIFLDVSESKPVRGRVFRFAGGVDSESGGFVLHEFQKNLNYCMTEKSEKIKEYYRR
jgi:hypothetical protein